MYNKNKHLFAIQISNFLRRKFDQIDLLTEKKDILPPKRQALFFARLPGKEHIL